MVNVSKSLRIVVALATVLILIFLAFNCIDIYLEGNSAANLSESGVHLSSVFSRDIVAARLSPLLPWLAAYVLLLIVSAVVCAKAGKMKHVVALDAENRLRLMKARLAELPEKAQKEEKFRRNVFIGGAAAVILCAIPCLVYLVNEEHFTSWDLEQLMGQLVLRILPFVVLAFAIMIAASFLNLRSMEREMEAIKAADTKPAAKTEKAQQCTGKRTNLVRIALFAAAALFVVLGVTNGGMRDVLIKAINICTECIGLG